MTTRTINDAIIGANMMASGNEVTLFTLPISEAARRLLGMVLSTLIYDDCYCMTALEFMTSVEFDARRLWLRVESNCRARL